MSSNLAPAQAQFLQSAIAVGKYRDESDAINQAISLLERRDQLEIELEAARKQIANGEGRPAEEVFQQLEQKAAEIESRGEI